MSVKELILKACEKRGDIPHVYIIDADRVSDGSIWFSYSFTESIADAQRASADKGLLDGVFDELVYFSDEMFQDAALYVSLRWTELRKGDAE